MQPIRIIIYCCASIMAGALSLNTFAAGGGGGGGFNAPSQSAPKFDPVATYQQAVDDLQTGHYKKASKGFRKVLSLDKKSANTQYLYGISLYRQGKYKKSVRPFQRAIKYQQGHILARGYISSAYQLTGKSDKATTLKQALLEQQRTCGDCDDKDKLDTAIKLADGAHANTTSSVLPLNNGIANSEFGDQAYLNAVADINRGNYQIALASLHESSLAFGPHPDVLTYLGFVNRKLGNMELALEYYQAALTIQDDHRGANEYLGEFYVEMGQLKLANAQLNKLKQICQFGCEEAEELKRWIDTATS